MSSAAEAQSGTPLTVTDAGADAVRAALDAPSPGQLGIPDRRFTLRALLAGSVEAGDFPEVEITGLCHDSRKIRPGDLFIALAGHRAHGMRHADQALGRGCAAILFDPAGDGEALARGIAGVPCIPVAELAQKLGFMADRFYGEPSESLGVIGVTGTNGKTSCSHFLAHALADRHSAAVIGTLGWGSPAALRPTTHTTPDAIEVHELLARLRADGVRTVAMEASSHGQVQGRLNGVRFKGALYTNFSRDHLDYHGTMDAYLEAKLGLLAVPGLRFVVFNADDPSAGAIMERKPGDAACIAFSVRGDSDLPVPLLSISEVRHGAEGIAFRAHFQGRTADAHAPVFGDFNLENLAATLAVLLALGHELPAAAEALARVRPVAGRMERFAGRGRTVVVDYAHTPDALDSVLTSLRRHCEGRLWVVFGCGGDRDRGKRPEMGAIAERLADQVVLTDDNPRSEDGDDIMRDIGSGCRREDIVRIRDRRAAIAWALERTDAGDMVLVAGKGHESTQEVRGEKIPFSDREVVRELLGELFPTS
jgi:UDP-N-acetylmuramoyl-L-alanyl-D-glutamate--2,6-diaminopimelate ligase